MHIFNKVLVGLIIVTSMAFFYLAARVLQTHQHWRDAVRNHERALESTLNEKRKYEEGDAATGERGMHQLELDLQKVIAGRGRVWKNVAHGDPDATNGAVAVMPQQVAAPTVIALNTQVFVFAQANDREPGAYLGDFKVTNVADKMWQIQPTRQATPPALAKMQQSRGPWVLYEKMPTPHPDFLPAEAPADKAGVDRYQEQLCSFLKIFDEHYDWRSAVMDEIASLKSDNQSLTTALAKAQQEELELRQDVDEFTKELAEFKRWHKAVAEHRGAVKERLAQMEKLISDTRNYNQLAAGELARIQLDAARQIDARTRGMVQAEAKPL